MVTRLRGILVSPHKPLDKNSLWLWKGVLYYNNGEDWVPVNIKSETGTSNNEVSNTEPNDLLALISESLSASISRLRNKVTDMENNLLESLLQNDSVLLQVEALTLKVEGLNSLVNGSLSIAEIVNLVVSITTDLDRIDALLSSHDNAIEGLNTSINSAETSIENINTSIENINTSIDNLDTSIEGLTTFVSDLNTSVDNINTSVSGINNSISTLNIAVENNSNNITDCNASINNINLLLLGVNQLLESVLETITDVAHTNVNNNFSTSLTINGDLNINGNINQRGENYETHAEVVYVKNSLINLRDDAINGLAEGEFTGLKATKYDGENDGYLVFDSTGEARVGDEGDTEPLLTRDEKANLVNGEPLVWDSANNRAITKLVYTIPMEVTYEDDTTETFNIVIQNV